MNINRQNYEVWFVDFLDGKLTGEDLARFHAFLAQNADLEAELHEISADLPLVSAENEKISITKKEIVAVGGLDEHSFETAFIAYHENDLSAEQINELEVFLDKNPFLRKEFAWFGQLVIPHSGESFPHKRALKHPVPLQAFYRYAAAASVLLLLGTGAVWYTRPTAPRGSALAYRPARVTVPSVHVADSYGEVAVGEGGTAKTPTKEKNRTAEPTMRTQVEGIARHRPVPVSPVAGTAHEPGLAQAPGLYGTQPPVAGSGADELTLVQALGKAIETGVGENGMADGLQQDRKITPGDMVDLAATPFKKSGRPVLATENTGGGKRRVKLRLGFFEADFALQ